MSTAEVCIASTAAEPGHGRAANRKFSMRAAALPSPLAPAAQAGAVLLSFPAHEMGPALTGLMGELHRYASKLARQQALAQDLVQETCRRALEPRARFASGTNLRSWLFCILRNLYCDHVRRRGREALVPGADLDAFPSQDMNVEIPRWRNIADADVALALASLPAKHREAYVLHSVQGKSYAEIARELEIPLSTVGTRLLRARRRLSRVLLARQSSHDLRS
jgi:RNA polymerase sigma-70 factor (ECF subfamily)